MAAEMVEAAGKLVRERARMAEQAVRARDASWSDDPGDRTARGRICGAGLGVCLGIASQSIGADSKLTPEERTEAMLDLHGLHAAEATEVLEEFLLAVCLFLDPEERTRQLNGFQLEREHFYGLGESADILLNVAMLTAPQRISWSEKKNIQALRTPRAAHQGHASRQESVSGCTCGGIPGASATA